MLLFSLAWILAAHGVPNSSSADGCKVARACRGAEVSALMLVSLASHQCAQRFLTGFPEHRCL